MPRKIKVHEKVLGHLSRGLYRSPASALRELVSNAWDADASCVRINTNFPTFFQVSVEDDGRGFTKEDFETLMEGGIGNTLKRPGEEFAIHGRPVIGRLGIGLLGIAQICGSFTIMSNPANGDSFKARVRLYDLLKTRLDSNEGITNVTGTVKEVDIGEYEFETGYDYQKRPTGTLVMTDSVHPTFTRVFQESLKFEKYKDPARNWEKVLETVSKIHSLQELGDYWRLLWELAACCPIPYLSEDALPEGLVREEQKILNNYAFALFVDGIQLFKPVYLHDNPNGYTTSKILPRKQSVYGKELSFRGYIVVQESLQLRPDELRGILIRIKNVGIGYYDPSMLDYRFNEGPRSRWVTGEIFVESGLEDALNIDRDTFNRFHPEYRSLQQYIHTLLREEVFPKVYIQIDVRSEKKAKEKAKDHEQTLKTVLSESTGSAVNLRYVEEEPIGTSIPLAKLEQEKDRMEILLPRPEMVKAKKQHRDLATAILSIFEIALEEKTHQKQREKFAELLQKLLSKW
jgi:hypothetical protein